MSQTFQCGDNPSLVGYLYGECEPDDRLAIEAHVQMCAACAAELAALESTRMQLSSWVPPESALGFQIVSARGSDLAPAPVHPGPGTPSAGARTPWYRQPLPAWAQAAAAVVIFAAGLAMGVARGTLPAAAPMTDQAVTSAPATTETVPSGDALAALEERLRAEIAQIQHASPAPAPAAAPRAAADAQLLARVRTLIEESEQRQQRELAFRTAQILRDVDSQRRVDLEQIQRTVGQIEGLTGAEVREQRQMLNYLIRASQQR